MVVFGNANRTYLPFLRKESFLDSLLAELGNNQPPNDNGQEVIDEINSLDRLTESIAANEELQKRYFIYDDGLEEYLITVLSNIGVDARSVVRDLYEDIMPLIAKLKYSFQRIRPTQLALLLQLKLYPFQSTTADSPSYPSAHVVKSVVYCHILGSMFPVHYKRLMEFANDVCDSRPYLGVNYQSDCEFGRYVADLIINHPEFKKKYKL